MLSTMLSTVDPSNVEPTPNAEGNVEEAEFTALLLVLLELTRTAPVPPLTMERFWAVAAPVDVMTESADTVSAPFETKITSPA